MGDARAGPSEKEIASSMLSIIAVIGKNRELGRDDKLLWHIPGDLPRFKALTNGHPVIMGRKTFESIGRPLPGRSNIVITANQDFTAPGITVAYTLGEALSFAAGFPGNEEIFVIGGGSIYALAIERADRLYLTIVDAKAAADTFFPDYSRFKKVLSEEAQVGGGYKYSYLVLES